MHIECINNLWYICNPDTTIAWNQGFKTRGWATRTLNWLRSNLPD